MIYRIDEHAKVQALLLIRAYNRNTDLSEVRNNKSLRLLYEAVDPGEDVKRNIENTKKIMTKIMSLFPTDTAAGIVASLKKLNDAIPNPSKVETELFVGDDKRVKEVAKIVSTTTGNAVRATSSLVNGLQLVAKALNPYLGELSKEQLEKPIGELLDDESLKGKIIPRDKFEAGIQKAFIPSKGFESAFQKGIKGAQASVEGGKTKLGQLFSTIAKFFVGATFKKASVDAFPDLFEAFKEYLNKAKIQDVIGLSTKIKQEGNMLVVDAAEDAAAAGAASAAVAGGAEVEGKDSKGKDEEKSAGPEDDKAAASAAETAVKQAQATAKTSTMGATIDGLLLKTLQPFADRKSLSKKSGSELETALKGLKDSLVSVSNEKGKDVAASYRSALENWFNGLDPRVQKNLGGPVGSKKVLQKLAKQLEDNILQNFELKSESRHHKIPSLTEALLPNSRPARAHLAEQNDNALDRWQKLAGIK